MNHKDILDAYKSGEITIGEVEEKLREMKQSSFKKPLSEGQKGLWMLQKMSPDMSAYNIPLCFHIRNQLDLESFKKALQFVVNQYPILTSVIKEDHGTPFQMIQPAAPLSLQQEDISSMDSAEILSYVKKKNQEPFVLEQGPLMRIYLFSRSEKEYIVLISIHHIIFDGISMMTFIPTLLSAYQDFVQGRNPVVTTLSTDYHDFVEWEQEMLKGNEGEKHLAYWKQHLSGTLPVLELPTDRPRSSVQRFKGQAYSSLLPDELSKQVKSMARSQDVNLSVIFLAIFKVLLHQYTKQDDIIVGIPTMGRPEDRFESLIGYFVNMIPVRSQEMGSKSFSEWIRELQISVVEGVDHAAYPFPALVKELNVNRTTANSPVFQVAFLYQNFLQVTSLKEIQEQYQSLNIEFVEEIRQEGEFELALEVYEQEEKTVLNLIYNPDLFDLATIERMMGHYIKLVEEIANDPFVSLKNYSLLPHEEQKSLLVDWNATQADYPKDKCIHELFEEKAQKNPHEIAVIFEGEALTYQELDQKSNQLAIYLQEQGVSPEYPVGICVDRSLEMIVGILGILKAGGAYVPLDPTHPEEQLKHMLKDSGVSIVLTQSKWMERINLFNGINAKMIVLDQDWEEIIHVTHGSKTLRRDVKSDHLAYVIYTSGSTGKPKGVMVEHRSILNTLFFLESQYPVTNEDTYLLKTNYVFDVSLSELFGWFIGNGRLIILPPNGEKSPDLLIEYIKNYKVTHINFVPAMLNVFLNSAENDQTFTKNCPIKYMMVAGEAFPKELVKKAVTIFENSRVENIYGPTEASIYATWFCCTKEGIMSNQTPIGKPIANTQAYIVDHQLKPVPIGIPGELCIAGDGLARGYYNQPELTAEKFIDNPFQPETKLYKTGDRARWLPEGQIEYLGRIDNQVKVRGFRIELDAIESRLSAHPGIQENVTVVKQQDGHKKLVTYYTASDGAFPLTSQELRNHLKSSLPEYMVPSHFICLDQMPLTPNGKVNRKELENRKIIIERKEKINEPQSKVEEKVLNIWRSLLQVDDVGVEDGFFDVGGDSLLAVVVAERIKKELHCDFSVTELFEYATIKAISQYISGLKKKDMISSPVPAEKLERNQIEMEELDHMPKTLPEYYQDSVAIIGISCRFPGAKDHFEFWNNLKEGKESIKFFTKEELRDFGVSEELIQNPDYVPVKSTIEGKDLFDPSFFGISPKDAELMDPQLRLLLLHSWKAIEDAGYVSKQIPATSVYMSASNNYYRSLLPRDATEEPENPDGYVSWVLGQNGTIPTMVSHKLGLKGPSYFVHSNCSSSLVGLYSAYQSLQSGEAKYALVGGATLHSQSNVGYVHQTGLNFSSDGHVKTFDASADGMTGGEGVAVILLKKAMDAIEDGDHIYALLRGIGMNNDGADKVGFYAPSVKGQSEVIQKVLDATKVNPESISYIEAHGTGTKLGDPIEFAALNHVYKQYTTKKQFCGIGSVKTNIGHLDTAAGLAGCIKVALSLYHHELVPSINYKEPNPNMDLDHSPFYVVDELKQLEESLNPYRAALSSFGLGGTNTHAIFEQYTATKSREFDGRDSSSEDHPSLIPISAKNSERLKAYTEELLKFLNTYELDHIHLANLAYTFQVGREAMDHRVIFIASHLDELKQQLEDFCNGKEKVEGCLEGEIKKSKDATPWLEDEDTEELIRQWITKRKMRKLAEMWVKGFQIDWELLYPGAKPHRMSLPTYPFAQERYWPLISKDDRKTSATSILHPLVHQNTSLLSEQRFSSTFTGEEYFIAEHIIKGTTIVPGVVTLEMARTAVEQAIGNLEDRQVMIRLKNVVWVRPIVVDQGSIQIHVGLFAEENGQIYYKMYSESNSVHTEPILYNQGIAELSWVSDDIAIDLETIQNQCDQGIISSEQFYKGMIGAEYGPGYRGVKVVYTGQGQLLAKLSLPDSVSHTIDQYILHPSLMDGALQVAEYLQNVTRAMRLSSHGHDFQAALPFALQELEVLKKCVPNMWVYVKYSDGNQAGDPIQKVDIDLCDDTGEVCVRMKGFSTRVLDGEVRSTESPSNAESLLLEPVWKEQVVGGETPASEYVEHIVILCECGKTVEENIETLRKDLQVLSLDSNQGSVADRFQVYAGQVFEKIKDILINKPKGDVLVQVVTSTQGEQQLFSGLIGLLKTARLENSKLIGQLIEVESKEDFEGIQEKLLENRGCPHDKHIRYQEGKRHVVDWNEVTPSQCEESIPWKDDGIYLITGGVGGLGLIFSKEIADKAKNVSLILTGRSTLGEDKKAQLQELRKMGARVAYKQTDVTEKEDVYHLIQEIQKEYGRLDGIIHGAGIFKDNYMIKKTQEELQEVIAPKVAGLMNLDEASKGLPLDFFILFSSVSGSLGSVGQADYATANTFMDAYAQYRNSLTVVKQRSGKTLSLNWPLWKEGGMRVDAETQKMLEQYTGIVPMKTETGIQALYQAFNFGENCVMIVEGKSQTMKQKLLRAMAPTLSTTKQFTTASSITEIDTVSLLDKVKVALKQEISKSLKLKIDEIEDHVEMSQYGFDSISMTEFTNKLNRKYKLELTPTIFFEQPTVHDFATYLVGEHQAVFAAQLNVHTEVKHSIQPVEKDKEVVNFFDQRRNPQFVSPVVQPSQKQVVDHSEPIAIVGMSGVFPMAKNMDEYWKNLVEGKDCITEIPKDRWDWQEYYGDPVKEANKTHVKWGGFIDGIGDFDPLFFGISPREAEQMDPQQRLLMTYVWKAIEDAGYSAQSLSGTQTGVFIGTGNTGYSSLLSKANVAIEGSAAANMSPSAGPNRVSYLLNINGPSEPIDTACSSSLVAIHHAISAIEDGNCEMAIAGGVNTIILPEVYITFDKAGALSKEGRCKAFSDQADGFAHGEGAGILFLKKLKAAERDGDHIYGIIRGTVVNHGGRANSLTTPNPKAQAELLQTAYTKAGIDPRTVTYIEAHGTGTKLGDPVEINGLKSAFKELYRKTGDPQVTSSHCGLGSVKTNIGHLSLAAGVAGVIKVLLQLKHQTLVKSLHCDTINPYIQLKDSPFYLVQETKEWKALKDAQGNELPRRAGVSSFGIGGVNAHVVIEEYVPKEVDVTSPASTPTHPAMIVLSAKNGERLQEQAQQLLEAISAQSYLDQDLTDLAYTLQVGRDAMEERLGIIVGSIKDLKEKLKSFVEGQENIEDLYRGKVEKGSLQAFMADEEMQEVIEKWIQRRKYTKLLDLWVKGLNVDWVKLYGDHKPNRISLPTYPFANERYWIVEAESDTSSIRTTSTTTASVLHPLLHQNTSNLMEQRFSSTYTGDEFFLAEHVVKGQRILPGVAHLEMAREAVGQAVGILKEDQACIKLKNVVWVRPIVVTNQPLKVHIGLYPEDDGEIAYEVYSESDEADGQPLMYSQGSAVLSRSVEKTPVIHLASLQAGCVPSTFSVSQMYDTYKMIGFNYGPSFCGVEQVFMGEKLVLAKLSLPSNIMDPDPCVLHPGMMDSALQASSILVGSSEDQLMLPFALEEIEVYGKCTSQMWACVRYSEDHTATDKIQKRDIDLCDEQGQICVRMKGLSFRAMEAEVDSKRLPQTTGTLMFEPIWRTKDVEKGIVAPNYAQHIILLCELNEISAESIEARMKGVQCIALNSMQEGIAERFQAYAEQVFEKIQSILSDRPQDPVLIQVVTSTQGEQQLFAGLTGLLKTAELESSKLMGQMIEIDPNEDLAGLVEKLEENKRSSSDKHIKYQDGKRYIADWNEVEGSDREVNIPWKDQGVYLITGGAGGLGLIFAKDIVQKAKSPTLILTGRSELSDKRAQLEEFQDLGVKVEYKQIDVVQKDAVDDLIKRIVEEYGQLNGIIHSAGIIRDSYIIKKTKEEMHDVLAPKVKGLVNLDEASKDLPLDFFILFSSISGTMGSSGQADYSMANAFMDHYAAYRNSLIRPMYRHGQTLSINWPLWKEGGMYVDAETEKMMMQSTGLVPMETATGIQALYKGLTLEKSKMIVMEGVLQSMKQKLLQGTPTTIQQPKKMKESLNSTTGIDSGSLLDQVQGVLKQEVSKLLKIKVNDINVDLEFNQYGFDSITLTEFANKLNEQYKLELTPTIFFEQPTIYDFATYLVEEHQAIFVAQFAVHAKVENPVQVVEKSREEVNFSNQRRHPRFIRPQIQDKVVREPIAIVGMSGTFPMAKNMDEYWKNLVEGKDCITEIPKDRWDWREYYGDPVKEANKTYVKWGGFIDGVGDFDPLFFGISPLEAEQMDPQQRLLMTYAWKAIEDAGYSTQSLSGTQTGVFIGTGNTGYSSLLSKANVAIEGSTAANMSPSVGPNRVSYLLNIHGPSEPIDTACSSSLVAIHHAVCAIEDGNCEMALAGGVNTVVTPEGHIAYDKAGALSKEGRCKTFSDQADGFAVGEGVGILFLKKLKAAERDGDHIYGIIRGTAENHGGRANSLTTPNPKAQAELLQTAYTKAGIDPRTVTYIEAHGTGTKLGDPIEINGLKSAFKELYQKTGDSQVTHSHCGLGSVKTNIGHLSLAAGVAGVIKVLLQLKHQTLVKSLHCDTINPYIQLKDSPFYLVQETKEWKALKDAQGNELPRRAGVSSFGIGGVNAHVVIEEYVPKEVDVTSPTSTPTHPAMIVLSAKNGERLQEQAQQLLEAMSTQPYSDRDLTDLAYTLQVGRDAMEERLGIIVGSIKNLKEKLKSFVEGQENIEDLYRGKVEKGSLQAFMADEEMQEVIEKWIQRRKYTKLLDLWVRGLNVDWVKLYGDHKPNRISLPTYPFASERYWITDTDSKIDRSSASVLTPSTTTASVLHPLLHQNTSDLSEQRFSSTFTGREFFFTDHRVKGNRVLPGVAYLEMARAAISKAVRGLDHRARIRIKNVVWTQPIVIESQPIQVDIGLSPQDHGEITYEVYTESEVDVERNIHSQGSVMIYNGGEVPSLDLKKLLAQCSQNLISSNQLYELYKTVGIDYGPSHQGIEKVYIGEGQVLAKLSLPSSVSNTADSFVLHPSMVDSALQASLALLLDSDEDQLSLPFALQEIDIFGKCTSQMWAYIRQSDHSKAEDRVQKLDIDLCDDQGKVCARIKGISSRVLENRLQDKTMSEIASSNIAKESHAEAQILAPVWDVVSVKKNRVLPAGIDDQVVIVGGNKLSIQAVQRHYPKARTLDIQSWDSIDSIVEKLKDCGSIDHIVWIAPSEPIVPHIGDEIIEGQYQGVIQIFRMIKAMLHLDYGNKDVSWSVITEQTQLVHQDDLVNPTHASIHGLMGSMAKEYSNWNLRLIDLETGYDWADPDLFTLPTDSQGNTWAYRNGEWYRQNLLPVQQTKPTQSLYKHGGVYVVVGGAGGIGEVWSEYVIRSYQAHVIWMGRRKKDEVIQAKLDRLATLGPAPIYIEADASDPDTMQQAYREIKNKYSQINGIIHSAIVLLDQSLANMDEERFKKVLATKVDVSVCMAQVFRKEPLDFAMFFSSIQSFAKAAGQSNYAAGCAFKDAFAHRLSYEWPCAVKVMNWSYWGSVGVVASQEYQQRMTQAGIGSIEPPEAMEALERLLSGPLDQLVMMKTTTFLNGETSDSYERIEVYPENPGSNIQKLRNYKLGDPTKIDQMI
ncbi:non-ribosomal peptide synthetase [Hazenella coriacea]|uniref:Polyketide synthase PksN n=1 Tax=Hazenella coriacea TaxID=1179467 RepID=A0A4R3L3Z7_9BACL|nr:non-ribosomal peptide synthetase [Hazenella coriacea]TCS93645.1 polyketide synthase PksN [Hazenella coriacea]